MNWKPLGLILITLLVTACNSEPQLLQTKLYALGTEISISLYGLSTEQANQTLPSLEQSFQDVDDTWHAWRPSTLSDINQAIVEQRPITVSTDVANLIEQARHYAEISQHLFNPAAGQLFELWGFHRDDWFQSRPPPSQATIEQWLSAAPDMTAITIKNNQLTSNNPTVKLGFGAFAKGYAVNHAIEQLEQAGIKNALVNIGGDLRAIGSVGDRPWQIGIRDPRQDGVIATIAVQGDQSVFTSGDYQRFFEYQGQRYPHILDPRHGYPADQAISVTVIHPNAALADAAATALFVAGQHWPQTAAAMGIEHVMFIKPNGDIELSPTMQERVHIIDADRNIVLRPIEGTSS